MELSKEASAFYARIRTAQAESGCLVVLRLGLERWYLETPAGRVLQGAVADHVGMALGRAGLLSGVKDAEGFYEWYLRFPLPSKPVQLSLFEEVA